MRRAQTQKVFCEEAPKDPTNATNLNDDKVRIAYLKETITKLLHNPQMAKKAAQIIEEMLHPSTQKSNK